jgi:hypothetical protein
MASMSQTKPTKCLLFCSPLLKGEGITQALAWNHEHLLDLRQLWELCQQCHISAGLLPMTQPPTMISNSVLSVENRISTATVTPPSSQIPHLTSPQPSLKSQFKEPFQPTAWQGLTSIVHKPQCWQVTSLMPLKTTKIPLQFHHPTTTVMCRWHVLLDVS